MPVKRRSPDNQPWDLQTRPFDTAQLTFTLVNFDTAFGDGIDPDALTYDDVVHIIAQDVRCGVCIRPYNVDGTLNLWTLNRTALFGVASKIERPSGQGGNFFKMAFGIAAAPPGN